MPTIGKRERERESEKESARFCGVREDAHMYVLNRIQ